MPAGLQIYDVNGNIVLDTTGILIKTGSIDIGVVETEGSIDIGGLVAAGTSLTVRVQAGNGLYALPDVSVNGNVVTWRKQAANADFQSRITLVLD